MSTTKQFSLVGTHQVSGLFWSLDRYTLADVQQRLLSTWQKNTRLYMFNDHVVAIWPKPIQLDVAYTLGGPLIRYDHLYSSILLSERHKTDYLAVEPSVILVVGGEIQHLTLAAAKSVEPSDWIDLSLGEPQAVVSIKPKPMIKAAPKAASQESRGVFGEALEKSDELKELTNKKDRQLKDTAQQRSKRRWFRSSSSQSTGGPDAANTRPQHPPRKNRGGFGDYIMRSPLGGWFARRQTAYFKKMLEMFENGDLEQALRHAVPMHDARDMLKDRPRIAMGLPNFRNNLDISRQRQTGSGSSYALGEEFHDYLKRVYLKSFKQLDEAGDHKKAAFVLAELLKDYDKAVSYLEEKGLYQLAAELAEGQHLPPARAVRQWILAGNVDRAFYIAHVTGCYREALALFKPNDKSYEEKLRNSFATTLAERGDFVQALEIGWSIEELPLVAWLNAALKSGQYDALRFVLKAAKRWPENQDDWYRVFRDIMADNRLGAKQRRYIYSALQQESTESQEIKSLAIRYYYHDVARGLWPNEKKLANKLLDVSGDALIQEEFKGLSISSQKGSVSLRNRSHPLSYQVLSSGVGPVEDVVLLENKTILVAMGEAGLIWLGRNNQVLGRWQQPAFELVTPDKGLNVLVLCPRSSFISVSIFRGINGSLKEWMELPPCVYATTFDGQHWLTAIDECVSLIDVLADTPSNRWEVNELPGEVVSMKRNQRYFSFLLNTQAGLEHWRYQSSTMFLRERSPIQITEATNYEKVAYSGDGNLVALRQDLKDQLELGLIRDNQIVAGHSVSLNGAFKSADLIDDWIVISHTTDEYNVISLCLKQYNQIKSKLIEFYSEKHAALGIKCTTDHLIVFTNVGAIQVYSSLTGEFENEWKVP